MYRNRSHHFCAWISPFIGLLLGAQHAGAITPVNPENKAPLASSFPGPLWQVFAPVGGTATTSQGHLTISVPGGGNHDELHGVNHAVRVVQAVGDVNFDVAIKIDSPMAAADDSTGQGLMVMIDDKNFITFELAADGTNIGLSAHTVNQGTLTTLFEDRTFREYQVPMHLRLTRTGKTYTAYYSVDGTVWIQCANFADVRVPAWIGPFASNYNATPAKAVPFIMAINWFNIL